MNRIFIGFSKSSSDGVTMRLAVIVSRLSVVFGRPLNLLQLTAVVTCFTISVGLGTVNPSTERGFTWEMSCPTDTRSRSSSL